MGQPKTPTPSMNKAQAVSKGQWKTARQIGHLKAAYVQNGKAHSAIKTVEQPPGLLQAAWLRGVSSSSLMRWQIGPGRPVEAAAAGDVADSARSTANSAAGARLACVCCGRSMFLDASPTAPVGWPGRDTRTPARRLARASCLARLAACKHWVAVTGGVLGGLLEPTLIERLARSWLGVDGAWA